MSVEEIERVVLTVPEAGRYLGLGRASSYSAAQRGDIPTIRIGRRLLVPRRKLAELLDGKQESPLERALAG